MYISEKQACINSDYEIIGEIMKSAFGDGKKTSGRTDITEADIAAIPKTSAEAIARFKAMKF